ncbi:helix-turn-helix transcriptional regulator [Bacillus smithii]|uniref:helix-turn-helix domain-containing protein n=1 Tax=Bacillus smithii TaxID=1479 RepID=UPI003D24A738
MFSKRLKALRLQMSLTQKDMANLLEISRQAYGRYEKGESEPSVEAIIKLSEFFNVTTDYLLGRTDQNEQILNELLDQKLLLFFWELKKASQAQREQLLKIWGIIKNNGN